MDEIKFYGRGGQGVVMASQMLGFAFFKAGFELRPNTKTNVGLGRPLKLEV